MKRISLFFITALSTSLQLLGSPVFVQQTREVLRARAYGAKTKVIFKVIDDMGRPVKNAAVGAGFYMNKAPGKNPSCKGLTDIDGIFVAHEESAGEVNYSIRKDGYYTTRGRIWLAGTSTQKAEIKDGKWQPYGKMHTVIIKPIRKPIPMYIAPANNWIIFPATNIVFGFDFEKNDLVKPYGKGITTDFTMEFQTDGSKYAAYTGSRLTFKFIRPYDGCYVGKKDLYSEFYSTYHANTNVLFTNEIEFSDTKDAKGKLVESTISDDEYLVLRTRSVTDAKGQLISSHYSKIYGKILFLFAQNAPGKVQLFYYYNSNSNDTNIEASPRQNKLEGVTRSDCILLP